MKFYGPIRLFHLTRVDEVIIIGKVKVEDIDKKNLGVPTCVSKDLKKVHSLSFAIYAETVFSPAGKGLTSWLSFVVSTVSLSLFHWYPGSGVVLDCIDS